MTKKHECGECAHWTEHRTDWSRWGACKELPNDKLEIELKTGLEGGFVKCVETEHDFGCASWQPKEADHETDTE